ncbi:DUF1932 domain-containing protein [Lichenihabitans psoromatis]|uniref:DUF1932 domain-containing protein n=1 Tax=Lichenihabitans psoromatis TaxID=2528642 RepID=UPI001035F0FC|nr:NAD(P)-dependent oxidoreductase [Lichenihabitans psoromatis]
MFSIVPPSEALATATHVADHIGASSRRPLYIDWNAVSPAKAKQCDAIIRAAGGRFADGGIIGLPPGPEGAGPLLFSSGPDATDLARLDGFGVRFKRLDGPVGVASSLKMSYAGITKGTIALGAAMLLAAHRAGCDEVLVAEMAVSQAQGLAAFQRSIPDMFGKAERWAPEIEEIAAFIGADHVEAGIYAEMASFYRVMAEDAKGDGALAATLSTILKPR